jgi:hypothetical protein
MRGYKYTTGGECIVDPDPVYESCSIRCEYWLYQNGKMEPCGSLTTKGENLCPEHALFVEDCASKFSSLRKDHPSKWNWTRKACQVYGVRGMSLGTIGKPSDAGKPDGLRKGERLPDVEEWAARVQADRITADVIAVAEPAVATEGEKPVPVVYLRPAPIEVEPPFDAGAELERLESVRAARIIASARAGETLESQIHAHVSSGLCESWTMDTIVAVCKRILADVPAYKGKGISPILWGTAIYRVGRGIAPSEKQIAAIGKIATRNPALYAPLLA